MNQVNQVSQKAPFVHHLETRLKEMPITIKEFAAILVFLNLESLITNAILDKYTKNPISTNLKNVRQIQTAFESLHALLNRIDAGEASFEK